jgi:putative transposase
MLLSSLPGYVPKGYGDAEAVLTLEQLEERFKTWLLSEYMVETHSETGISPKDRWETFPFLPRLPDSIDQLDHLLMTVARTRRVRRDGIRFSEFRYFDTVLSGYIGEDVIIRFDPRDLAQIHVYSKNLLICRATCYELSGKTISLKEVRQARNHETKIQKQRLNALLAAADKYVPIERATEQNTEPATASPVEYPKLTIRRFACDVARESDSISDDQPIP